MKDQDGILLESGTNEVEVLEFEMDKQGFGVNVLKVQAIEQFDAAKVTEIQLAHRSVIGTYNYRDGVITLVDLGKEMALHDLDALTPADSAAVDAVVEAMPVEEDAPTVEALTETSNCIGSDEIETRIVLVLEFNETTTGFLVGGVNRIHRVSWNMISPISPYLAASQSRFTGSLNIENREVLMVDMERILADIIPATGDAYCLEAAANAARGFQSRADVPVYLAEDSPTIRSIVSSLLDRGGYKDVHGFDNGLSCYQALQKAVADATAAGENPDDAVGIVVSDIEMPQMDGMTMCRRVKNDLGLNNVPVVLFSSLINEQIARKCDSVGADGYVSKPRFGDLLDIVDRFALPEDVVNS